MIYGYIRVSNDGNFGCFMANGDNLTFGLCGVGNTAKATIEDLYKARDFMKECFEEEGKTFPYLEFTFKFDVGSLFDYYPLNVTSFAKYIGMNQNVKAIIFCLALHLEGRKKDDDCENIYHWQIFRMQFLYREVRFLFALLTLMLIINDLARSVNHDLTRVSSRCRALVHDNLTFGENELSE